MEESRRTRRSSRGEGNSANHAANSQGISKSKKAYATKEETARKTPLSSSGEVHTHLGKTSDDLLINELSLQPSIKHPSDRNAGRTDDIRSPTDNKKREHFTRSKQEARQEKGEKEDELEEQIELEEPLPASASKPKLSLNGCATILASIDVRSHHRALIHDANKIAECVLLPMSLPWTHKVAPITRNIPCDIDEMIDVLTMDDGLHTPFEKGSFGFGQIDIGHQRRGESSVRLANSSRILRAAARRSKDPGVIEFSTVALPLPFPDYSKAANEPSFSSNYDQDDDHSIKDEVLLRCFEKMQARKKRKVVQARCSVKNYHISVKINSSSSRSSIFKDGTNTVPERQETISSGCLEATLWPEVDVGRKLSNQKAKVVASAIGSYNVREVLGQTNQSGKNSNRSNVGRKGLMWTRKSQLDQPQRIFYTSLLTGQKLEDSIHKRPREILVRIKLNGKTFNGWDMGDYPLTNGEHDLNSEDITPFQASLDCDQLVRNLLDKDPPTMTVEDFILPKIECIPDSCGALHVVCVAAGKIPLFSVSSTLNLHAACKDVGCCTVCWRSTERGMPVLECSACGLRSHLSCCLDPGRVRNYPEGIRDADGPEWTCSVCCKVDFSGSSTSFDIVVTKKSKRKSKLPSRFDDSELVELITSPKSDHATISRKERQCAICLLYGGAMSQTRWGREQVWLHEVCRIWSSGVATKPKVAGDERFFVRQCALCGSSAKSSETQHENSVGGSPENIRSACVVRCAAAGCHVFVHPMCALVSSLTSKSSAEMSEKVKSAKESDVDNAKKNDRLLCTQFTLTFASVCAKTNSLGKDPGETQMTTLPVLFCGIHNPRRESSFYGQFPGGNGMLDTGKVHNIPRCREPITG